MGKRWHTLGLVIGGILAVIGLNACKTTRDFSHLRETKSDEFVQRQGTGFSLNGQPFRFQGTNFYRLALLDRKFTPTEIDDIMRQLAASGIKVIRFWGFSCETPDEWIQEGLHQSGATNPPLLNAQGVVSQQALDRLDLVLAKAGEYGVKVILPLVNFEHEYCGMEWWNRLYGDKHESKQAFYCNAKVKNAYKAHVKTLLTRVNSYNGSEYRQDPAIMAIEVSNEPHTTDFYEKGVVDQSCKPFVDGKPGTLVNSWLKEITGYVRSLDRHHLISTGEEGYKTSGNQDKHSWIHDGSKGVDFERNIQLPDVDFATVHLYPDNWRIPAGPDFYDWFVPHVLKDRAAIAHKYDKPIIMEETGYAEFDPNDTSDFMKKVTGAGYAKDRPFWLGEINKAAADAGYAGTLVWQSVPVSPQGAPYDDDLFTFSFNDPSMKAIRDQIKRFALAPDVGGGIDAAQQPAICSSAQSDPDGDGWGFESGKSCRVNKVDQTQIPDCKSEKSDPDGDGWGWENGASCKVKR